MFRILVKAFAVSVVAISLGCGGGSTASGISSTPMITSFTSPTPTINVGNSATLSFTFSGGTGVIDQSVGKVISGAPVIVLPTLSTTYTLTVTSSQGSSVSEALSVNVDPAITSFTANPATIAPGGSTQLTAIYFGGGAQGRNAVINPGNLAIWSGIPISITPPETTTYTLSLLDGSTSQQQTTVVVTPAIALR